MAWFQKKSSKRIKAAAALEKVASQGAPALAHMKEMLENSINVMTSSVNEMSELATDLNKRLKREEDSNPSGVAFVSRTGKLLFINKSGAQLLGLRTTDGRRIMRLHKEDGSSQSVVALAAAVFEGSIDSCFDIKYDDGKFLFKEPVVVEFDQEEVSPPVLLKASLADNKPQTPSDVIFICHVSHASDGELARSFKTTTIK